MLGRNPVLDTPLRRWLRRWLTAINPDAHWLVPGDDDATGQP